MFAQRRIEPEWLDHAVPEEARSSLADLTRINRGFGGHSVLRDILARVARGNRKFSLLDIGAASGDTAALIDELYPEASVTSLDYSAVNLTGAPFPKVIADAFDLPFPIESFDYVLCSLFLHHFTNEQVIRLLRSFYKVARAAVLVNDLERHFFPYCFLPMTKRLLGWHRLTVHDGSISIRASFRPGELLKLSSMAGIDDAEVKVHRPAFRISLVAKKKKDGAIAGKR